MRLHFAVTLAAMLALSLGVVGCGPMAGPAAQPQAEVIHRVNVGAAEAYTDQAGNVWQPDQMFTPAARWGVVGGMTVLREGLEIPGTDAPGVYLTERYDMVGYRFVVDDGTYSLRLHFAETWDGITSAGQRVFTVRVNDQIAVPRVDPFGTVGFARPLVVEYGPFEVVDEPIDIMFDRISGGPLINGIEIIRHDP